MTIGKIISRYTRYNHWANETLIQWLRTLDSNLLHKETSSSFATIDLTLQHMRDAQHFWIGVIAEDAVARMSEPTGASTADSNMNELLEGSEQMIDIFNAYTEEVLQMPLTKDDMVQSRYEYILHVINHNSYHRGQIVTMIRSLGIVDNIPTTDYDIFLWHEQRDVDTGASLPR